ncbi:MAG: FAD-dependent oxidoreductase [Thermodesulfobacteriota bacterium]
MHSTQASSGQGAATVPAKASAVVLGAGLAGLAAGAVLADGGRRPLVFEAGPEVGGLSRTLSHGGFRFDIGGHRFLTRNRRVEAYVRELVGSDLLEVPRKSVIHMLGRSFDYPLSPANALFGLGLATTAAIISDYCKERLRAWLTRPAVVSLEDWVVGQFGRRMFDLYFKDYSEKVWGLSGQEISEAWVAQRIQGLSLWTAIKNAFTRLSGRDVPTLADSFLYPAQGIGEIAQRLAERICRQQPLLTRTRVTRLAHAQGRITGIHAENGQQRFQVAPEEVVASIPLSHLVRMLSPQAPAAVRAAADRLRFRDLVIVTIMVAREEVTDCTWLYLPGADIPFGRIHEPTNWSRQLAPPGYSHLVAEYFCFQGDRIWSLDDQALIKLTVQHLARLGYIEAGEVTDGCVHRCPQAYPLFEVGYQELCDQILDYLAGFANLQVVGRGGLFRYYNMDHALASGMAAAEAILARQPAAHPLAARQPERRLANRPAPVAAGAVQAAAS